MRGAENGAPSIIVFSGNRKGMSDEEGLENCVIGVKKVDVDGRRQEPACLHGAAEQQGEPPDYMCDHTKWGVELVKRVGSPNFKLLYDIYHMQIMEGDVIRTMKDNMQYIGHLHTGGNPGRNEIDETQELNYTGHLEGHRRHGLQGLHGARVHPQARPDHFAGQAMDLCDV